MLFKNSTTKIKNLKSKKKLIEKITLKIYS